MIKVICKTNLDLYGEKWPEHLPALPAIGHLITSSTKWKNGFQLSLEVVEINWIPRPQPIFLEWIPIIEMHLSRFHTRLPVSKEAKERGACDGSITAFYEWYAPLVGKTASAFI